jgi:UDP-N-acetylglucosamine acyltransferase
VSNQIHATALVAGTASLGKNNVIGPYAIIEDGVELGDNNVIAAHAVLKTGTQMQNANRVHEGAVLGGPPQHTLFTDESVVTYLKIGSDNVFREAVTVNRSYIEGESTLLGNGNYLMYAAHIGHDCVIGDNNIFVTSCGIGGHVTIADRAFISGGVMVHQFVHIGSYAMLGGNSKITQDVLPFMITDGNPATVRGLNLVGLKRAGFKMEDIRQLKQAYRILFRAGVSLEQNLDEITALDSKLTAQLAEFVRAAERGFHRAG